MDKVIIYLYLPYNKPPTKTHTSIFMEFKESILELSSYPAAIQAKDYLWSTS